MAITTASATIQFNVGSFDYQTGLDLPPTSYEDKITPEFNDFVTDDLDSPVVFVMYSVSFQGVLQYQHPQFNADLSQLQVITNPDVRLDEGSGSDDVTINKFPDIIKTSAGIPASGQYVITLRYAYYVVQELTPITVTYTINFVSPTVEPSVSYWYDTIVPILTVEDKSNYTTNGVTATQETEFRLFPPMSGTPNITTGTALSVTYSSFWAGKNELQYTILLSYLYPSHEVLVAHQSYSGVPVVNVNRKEVYTCLKLIYEQWRTCPCGTKQYEVLEGKVKEATILAQLIVSGSGCGLDTLTEMVERFNRITGCDCSKPTLMPKFIAAGLIAETTQVQNIVATTANTIIDLSVGNKIYLELEADTQVSFINPTSNEKYTLIVTSYDGFVATFDTDFSWGGGWELPADPESNPFGVSAYYFEEFENKLVAMLPFSVPEPLNDGNRNTLREENGDIFWEAMGTGDFLSAGDNVSLLTNDAGYLTPSSLPSEFERISFDGVGSSFLMNLASTNANVYEVSSASSILTISVAARSAIQLARPYVVIVRNTGASPMNVSFAAGDFLSNFGTITSSVSTFGAKSFLFFGGQPSGSTEKRMILSSAAENYVRVGDSNLLLQNDSNFVSQGQNITLLNNNAGYITSPFTYSDIGGISGFLSIDFANDGEYQKFDADGDITFAAQGLIEGRKYGVIVKNNSATQNRTVAFTSPSFVDTPTIFIPRGLTSFIALEFMAVFISGSVRLVPSSQEARQLAASAQSTQTVSSDATIPVDLSLSPTSTISLEGALTDQTISLTGLVPLREYTLILKNDGTVTKSVGFSGVTLYDIGGTLPEITFVEQARFIVVIQSTETPSVAIIKSVTPDTSTSGAGLVAGDDVSLLTNDAGYLTEPFTYENVGAQGNYTADFSDKNIVYLQVTSLGSTISATNITEGQKYTFVIRNTDTAGNAYVFWNPNTFQNSPSVTVPTFINLSLFPSIYAFEFIAVNTGTLIRLVPSTSSLPSIAKGFAATTAGPTWTLNADAEKDLELNISQNFTLSINSAKALEAYRLILHNTSGAPITFTFGTPSVFVPTIYDSSGATPTYTLAAGEYSVLGIQMTSDDSVGVVSYKTP